MRWSSGQLNKESSALIKVLSVFRQKIIDIYKLLCLERPNSPSSRFDTVMGPYYGKRKMPEGLDGNGITLLVDIMVKIVKHTCISHLFLIKKYVDIKLV